MTKGKRPFDHGQVESVNKLSATLSFQCKASLDSQMKMYLFATLSLSLLYIFIPTCEYVFEI